MTQTHMFNPPGARSERRAKFTRTVCASVLLLAILGVTGCTPTTPTSQAPVPTPATATPTPGPANPTTPSASPSRTTEGNPQPQTGELSSFALKQSRTILDNLMKREGASDPRYYNGKVWRDGTPECARCTVGPAVLSAAYAASTNSSAARKVAVESLDYAIKTHQHADGSWGPAAPGEDGLAIQTVLFANAVASSYVMLGSRLDAKHRSSWSRSLAHSADYLIDDGVTNFYVNGNINLAVIMNLDLTYRITGDDRFQASYRQALNFTLNPDQKRWPGFGLAYSHRPAKADGSDGAGYLAESGGAVPGFDPAYTANQASLASVWYLLTGTATAKRLSNLFFNQLYPRVRKSDWTLDVSGGTRRGAPGTRYGFEGPVLAVLALKGGRTDLKAMVKPQVSSALKTYARTTTFAHSSGSYGFGAELGPTIFVITSTPGW